MKEIKLKFEDENPIQIIIKRLKGKVFHVTSKENSKNILKTKMIRHNQDESFKINTSSTSSFGRLKGYVCLFDFRNASQEEIMETHNKYSFTDQSWFAKRTPEQETLDLSYFVLSPKYYGEIIPNSAAYEAEKMERESYQKVDRVEVWIKNFIALDKIEEVISVSIVSNTSSWSQLSRACYLATYFPDHRLENK